jgi:hypothetical protein
MRIQFIDALRGVAALAVVLHHFNESLGWLPFSYGNLGVPVFFVLSGFVIAMSVGDSRVSAGYLGRFALRRALRLDPPYWLTIALVVGIGYALKGYVKFDGVTVPQVAAHMFYLQDILSFKPILPVFWTLCYEVQFYLALILITWLMQAFGRPPFVLVGLLLLASVADRHFEITHHSFMGRFWSCFALGCLTFWAQAGRVHHGWVVAAVAFVLGYGLLAQDGYAITSSLTAAAILIVLLVRRPDFLSGPVWQFLGRISYSLYLTHLLFGWMAFRLTERVLPGLPAVAAGVAVAIVAAWLFYIVAERPAVTLSRRVRMRKAEKIDRPEIGAVQRGPAPGG